MNKATNQDAIIGKELLYNGVTIVNKQYVPKTIKVIIKEIIGEDYYHDKIVKVELSGKYSKKDQLYYSRVFYKPVNIGWFTKK